MAKKPPKTAAPALFPDLAADTASVPRPAALPASVRPLFLPDVVDKVAQGKHIDPARRDAAHQAYRRWIGNLRSGQFAAMNEVQLETDFYTELLAPLGHVTAAKAPAGSAWSMQIKYFIPGAGTPDAALGRFQNSFASGGETIDHPLVMVEVERLNKDLDRRESSGRSPVQQAWDYLNAVESARWAIVSNYAEVRLYSKLRGSRHVDRVVLTDLDEPDAFARFYAVFHAESLLGTGNFTETAEWMLRETGERQEKVGEALYREYAARRAELIRFIQDRQNVGLDPAIRAAQTLLDRVLFVAFAEDRGLLPDRLTLESASSVKVPGLSRWRAFQLLFRAIDLGDPLNQIPRYNGSLFKPDPILDDPNFDLDGDAWPTAFKTIGSYDFKNEVTVDVLGRIFERSITDIEEIRGRGLADHESTLAQRRKPGKRKTQGVFYTDAAIVDYLVAAALEPTWAAARAQLAAERQVAQPLPDPPPPDLTRALLVRLKSLTLCDPACGSGAFLNAAYNWFEDARVNLLKDLQAAEPNAPECAGDEENWRADAAPQILRENLFGVDISAESVEIARLSLWVRTARKGQALTDLTANVVVGNSVVDDPAVDPLALRWEHQFPAVAARGGFDAVVGNPPYVRQEWLGGIKPHLQGSFQAYHGMADLYVYFYEQGLRRLRPGGRLAYVVTNKWMKAGYGEPLRRLFAVSGWVEEVVDFGHAKPFFNDADVFPCFLVARKPDAGPAPESVRVCVVPRDLARLDQLKDRVRDRSQLVGRARLGPDPWQLEPQGVIDLLAKIRDRGVPLAEFAGVKPYRGVLTGLNEAFLIDTPTHDALVAADPNSAAVLKPYLRGQDIKRWSPEWAGMWMIVLKSSGDHDWPWKDAGDQAEAVFQATFPSIHERFKPLEGPLRKRQDQGRFWWELRSCDYYDSFARPKIFYQEIQYHPSFALDESGAMGNNKTFLIQKVNYNLLSILCSPLLWCHNWRYLPHMKDEALSPIGALIEKLPIAPMIEDFGNKVTEAATRLIETAKFQQTMNSDLLNWLKIQHEITEPSQRLQEMASLSSDAFVAEVQKLRGKKKPLSAAGLKGLRAEYTQHVEPARTRVAEARGLERQINDLVNQAYGLTPEEVQLMWDTAPPRMPIPAPDPPTPS